MNMYTEFNSVDQSETRVEIWEMFFNLTNYLHIGSRHQYTMKSRQEQIEIEKD